MRVLCLAAAGVLLCCCQVQVSLEGKQCAGSEPACLDGYACVQGDCLRKSTWDGGSCTAGTSVLCDDFEGPTLSPARWEELAENGGMTSLGTTADGGRSHGGAQSLHALVTVVAAGDTRAIVRHVGPLPARFFARVYAFLPPPAPPGGPLFMGAQESGPEFRGASLAFLNGELGLVGWGNMPNLLLHAGSSFPTGRWVCVEWFVDASRGATAAWIDEVEVTSLRSAELVTPTYGWFKLGIELDGMPSDHYELWLDDLWVDTAPIGCRQP